MKHKSDGNDIYDDHGVRSSNKGEESPGCEKGKSSSSVRHSSSKDRECSERDRYRSTQEPKDHDKDRIKVEGIRKERDRDKARERGRTRDKEKDKAADRYRDKDKEKEIREHDREEGTERDREGQQEKSKRRRHSERHFGYLRSERSRDQENHDMEHGEKERQSELRQRDLESRPAGEGVTGFAFTEAMLLGNQFSVGYKIDLFKSEPFCDMSRTIFLRRSKEKKEEVAKPEADPERDQRTVFVYQISLKADERDVYEFFSRAGKVRDVSLIMDRNSRRFKGFGYVEFYNVMAVPMAIALSGQPLLGQPVMVKPSEAEKNLVQSTASMASGATGFIGPYSGEAGRLYVGNLHSNIKEDQLRQVFEPFGTVEMVQLPSDPETGLCKGYGFVQFSRLEDARAAISLDGQLDIAGQVMKVAAVTDQTGGQGVDANAGGFEDDEGGGLALNAQSQTLLIQNLDHTGISSSTANSLGSHVDPNIYGAPVVSPIVPFGQTPIPAIAGWPAAGLSVPAVTIPSFDIIGVPSECLLLKNMFDPKFESEPNFDQDIKDDVEDECSVFGKLKHIYVDKKSAGFVYLRFENSQCAIAAQRGLHGRWFAGKMITAAFMVQQHYEAKFPESK